MNVEKVEPFGRAMKRVRARIAAGEDLVGVALFLATGQGDRQFVVAAIDRERNTVTLKTDEFAWVGPIVPRKRSDASRQRDRQRRALERELRNAGLPPCAWREPTRFGGGEG